MRDKIKLFEKVYRPILITELTIKDKKPFHFLAGGGGGDRFFPADHVFQFMFKVDLFQTVFESIFSRSN